MKNRFLRFSVGSDINNHLVNYPMPSNVSYLFTFGSISGLFLVIQILTGMFLAMHYCANAELAFNSVEHIMRDVNNGYLIRYCHSNAASFFFVVVYIHVVRGLYYGSYIRPRSFLWLTGLVILLLMILTAFIGYVLPYGQMSFYGSTVISNLVTAIPYVGQDILHWILGSYSVDNATLNRFYSLHYMLPFIIAAVALMHLVLLHTHGSTNRIGISTNLSKVTFYPYAVVKDLFSLLLVLGIYGIFVYFEPNALGHSDNYIEADRLVTPKHIVPEWYFLPFYAILRSVPDKLFGVLLMLAAIVVFALLPIMTTAEVRVSLLQPLRKKLIMLFVIVCFILGYIGQQEVETPYVEIGRICTVLYFGILLVGLPLVGKLEGFMIRRM